MQGRDKHLVVYNIEEFQTILLESLAGLHPQLTALTLQILPPTYKDPTNNKINEGLNLRDLRLLMRTLASINKLTKEKKYSPPYLNIHLSRNRLNVEAADLFVNAMINGEIPDGISINLQRCFNGPGYAYRFASAFASVNCPVNMRIDLSENNFKDAGANHIAAVLSHPKYLSLNLNHNSLSSDGIKRISQALTESTVINIEIASQGFGFFNWDTISEECLKLIRYFCMRNKLLKKLNDSQPDSLEAHCIKQVFLKNQIPLPDHLIFTVPPLKFFALSTFVNQNNKNDFEKLPEELQQLIMQFKELDELSPMHSNHSDAKDNSSSKCLMM